MDQGPLVKEQIDGGAKFIQEFAKYTPVQAAFWLKGTEDNQWFLYVAGDQIDDSNFDVAYGEVTRITAKMPDPWLDPFQIKVVGANKPIAKAVLQIQAKYPGNRPIRYHAPLAGMSIEEAYIYPLPIHVPA
jgi:hypothetical protein